MILHWGTASLIFHMKSSWQQWCLCPAVWIILTVGEQLTWCPDSQTGSTGLLSTAVEVHIRLTRGSWAPETPAHWTWAGCGRPHFGKSCQLGCFSVGVPSPNFVLLLSPAGLGSGGAALPDWLFPPVKRRKCDLNCQQATKKSCNTPGERQGVHDTKISSHILRN